MAHQATSIMERTRITTAEQSSKRQHAYECRHRHGHPSFKAKVCEWCRETFERPVCFPKDQRCCTLECSRALKVAEYTPDQPRFKHGITAQGYRRIRTPDGRRMLEHRYVMEQELGRVLTPLESVHHIDGDKLNNSLSNLQLMSSHHGPGSSNICGDCYSAKLTPIPLSGGEVGDSEFTPVASWLPGSITHYGYRTISINKKRVYEHRHVMSLYLGRELLPAPLETVHHINGNRLDNRIENLQLMAGGHTPGVRYACIDCGSKSVVPLEIAL